MNGGSCFVQRCDPPVQGDSAASGAGSSSPSLRSITCGTGRLPASTHLLWLLFRMLFVNDLVLQASRQNTHAWPFAALLECCSPFR